MMSCCIFRMMWAAGSLASVSMITYPSMSALVSCNAEADQQGYNLFTLPNSFYLLYNSHYMCTVESLLYEQQLDVEISGSVVTTMVPVERGLTAPFI